MNEMTPAERVALDTLRATALAKMSDADFANLETEVASKGLQNLNGASRRRNLGRGLGRLR